MFWSIFYLLIFRARERAELAAQEREVMERANKLI